MIHHACEPRSADWFKLRLGIPTASEFHKVITPGGKLSKQSPGYAYSLLAELMLGRPLDSPETTWMTRGTELEDQAIMAYEVVTGIETSLGGFITNDAGTAGCSPDRLVGDDGILEMKVPAPQTHVGYLLTRDFGDEKKVQVQGQLWVSERKWVDLVSYHPELPPVILRVERDEEYIALLADALDSFVAVVADLKAKLIEKYGPFPEIVIGAQLPEPKGDFDLNEDDLVKMYGAEFMGSGAPEWRPE